MRRYAPTLFAVLLSCAGLLAQEPNSSKSNGSSSAATATPSNPAITANSTPVELARAALAAQGEKFKTLKSMWLVGSVDLYAPNSTQSVPGKFSLVTAGERMRLDVDASPVFKFKQIFDGQQSYSSIPGVETPPANKFGLLALIKYDQPGYTVSALPDKKKLRGFRIADNEGNTTDFFIDPATGRVMQYLTPYNGYTFGVENSKFKEVEGVVVPFAFTQRLEMAQGAFFAEYKVKEVKVNQPIGDDVFVP